MKKELQCFYASDMNRLESIELTRETVHIWKIRWCEMSEFLEDHVAVLDGGECERAERYYHIEDKSRYMTGKVVCKVLIGHYLGISADKVQFQTDHYGKPHLLQMCHEEEIYFNISHSGAWIFLAFSLESKVGIDVEERKELTNYQRIARTVFSSEEYEFLLESDDIDVFYDIWTAKEAYIKWIGQGLSYDLKSFSVVESLYSQYNKMGTHYMICPLHEKGYAGHFIMDK